MVGEAFRLLLLNEPGVTSIVGEQIYPSYAPQRTSPPYVVFRAASRVPMTSQAGDSNVAHVRMSIDLVATSYSQMELLCEAVRDRFSRFDGYVAGKRIIVTMNNSVGRDVTEPPYDANQTPVWHWFDEASVWYFSVGV